MTGGHRWGCEATSEKYTQRTLAYPTKPPVELEKSGFGKEEMKVQTTVQILICSMRHPTSFATSTASCRPSDALSWGPDNWVRGAVRGWAAGESRLQPSSLAPGEHDVRGARGSDTRSACIRR